MARIAILVLGCASEPYVRLTDTSRATWASRTEPDIDIFYVYGIPTRPEPIAALNRWLEGEIPTVEEGGIRQIGDVLVVGVADLIRVQKDCLLHKRLNAFEYLARDDRYEFIHTVCASSYVDQRTLAGFANELRREGLVAGAFGCNSKGHLFVSGASFLLSADVARHLGKHKGDVIATNRYGFRDDVAISDWIIKNLSKVSADSIVNAIKTRTPLPEEAIFMRANNTTRGFVNTPAEKQRPAEGVYHYHFHSKKADDMAEFHGRYFQNSV